MKVVGKIIFWTSVLLIISFVVLPFIIKISSLEFINDDYTLVYENARFYLLPICILLTLFGTIKKSESRDRKGVKIGLTVLASFISLIVLFFSIFADMCSWTDNKILFIKADDPKTKIVLRDYGCGATDSGKPIYKIFKVTALSSYLVHVTVIDTTKMDKTQWTQINPTK